MIFDLIQLAAFCGLWSLVLLGSTYYKHRFITDKEFVDAIASGLGMFIVCLIIIFFGIILS